jgi:transcriptional regulator with XRE-family HTH domain
MDELEKLYIRSTRITHGLTQEELAAELNVIIDVIRANEGVFEYSLAEGRKWVEQTFDLLGARGRVILIPKDVIGDNLRKQAMDLGAVPISSEDFWRHYAELAEIHKAGGLQ